MSKYIPLSITVLSLGFVLANAVSATQQFAFSPDKKHIVTHARGKITVSDAQGKQLSQFVPQDSTGAHTGIMEIYFVDNNRLGIRLHKNPSMDYLSITDLKGKELEHYLGYAFFWSHDRSAVAHVGQMIHFADWPHSEYIQVNDRTVYPTAGPAYGKEAKTVHTFTPPFCWSPDDGNLAVIDEVDGADKGKYLVIIPTREKGAGTATNKARRLKILPQQSAPIALLFPEGVKVTWQGKAAVKISSAADYRGNGLPCTISLK
ncbi:MAG: hypothetical protein SFV17_28105 [Candidatus Obscuribacter sp.]|nr:hypothetical protein [Candidatus Obscuribacter sp.]